MNMLVRRHASAIFSGGILVFPVKACADTGLPMIGLTLPGMLVLLIPVILLEASIMRNAFDLTFRRSIAVSSYLNAASTVMGTPLTWVLLVVLQVQTGGEYSRGLDTALKKFLAVTWQAPWLLGPEDSLHWMVPAAILFLLIPFFLASWGIEYLLGLCFLKGIKRSLVRNAVFRANLLSYALITLLVTGWLSYELVR